MGLEDSDDAAARIETAEQRSKLVVRARAALSSRDEGFSREESVERARRRAIRSRKR